MRGIEIITQFSPPKGYRWIQVGEIYKGSDLGIYDVLFERITQEQIDAFYACKRVSLTDDNPVIPWCVGNVAMMRKLENTTKGNKIII